MNMDSIGRYLHKDFHHVIHPRSLGVPELDKEACLERFSELGTGYGVGFTTKCWNILPHTYNPLQVTFHSVIEAPGKVVIHVSTSILLGKPRIFLIHTILEVENPYGLDTKCEAIYIAHFVTDDDGSLKLKLVDEFTDSKVFSDVRQALQRQKLASSVLGVRSDEEIRYETAYTTPTKEMLTECAIFRCFRVCEMCFLMKQYTVAYNIVEGLIVGDRAICAP